MNYFFKEKLKDRLEYCLDWRRDTELYLMSKSLTNMVNEEYYKKRPIRKFLLTIYLLPINLINFCRLSSVNSIISGAFGGLSASPDLTALTFMPAPKSGDL